jgi:glycosyltransferase involved in cell wall biosynthesis
MRVLTLTNLYPNPLHPTRAPFNRQQLRVLAEQHEVRVISPIAWTDELSWRLKGGRRLPTSRQVCCDGIPVEHPRYFFPPKYLRGWYGHCYRESVRSTFRRALAEFRPDVVYSPWAYPDGWAGVELGHQAGLPVVVKVHGSDVLLLSQCPRRKHGTVSALRRADAVVTVSHDLARRLVELGVSPSRAQVIYCGVDHALFHPGCQRDARARLGLPLDEPILLFIGNLVPVKAVDVLLDAWARLAGSGVAYRGYCIGRGPLQASLQAGVRRLGLSERVQFLGARPHHELPDWYRAASAFVLPSYSEGVPNVLLEATACGTPFVATRVGGIPEIAHLGLSRLVAPGDAAALAEAIRDLLGRASTPAMGGPPRVRSHAQAVAELVGVFERLRGAARTGNVTLPCSLAS